MALIAPNAFLWLTYEEQALYGAPTAGSSMWIGIVFALVLCFATAMSYSELSKLYPGAGSFVSMHAEQWRFSPKPKAFKWARLIKFFTGWEQPFVLLDLFRADGRGDRHFSQRDGCAASCFADTFSTTYNSPLFMWLFCVRFSLLVGYIAFTAG